MSTNQSHSIKTISSILNESESALGKLTEHIKILNHINQKLISFFEEPLSSHCFLANLTNDSLLLFADSPAWAAKLRFKTAEILEFMHHDCQIFTLKTVRVRVAPVQTVSEHKKNRRLTISPASASLITNIASTLADTELRNSMHKLGQHGEF